jgi:hypothetical protein
MVRLWISIMEKPYTRPQEYGSGVQEAARHDAGRLAGEERSPGRQATGNWLRPTARTERRLETVLGQFGLQDRPGQIGCSVRASHGDLVQDPDIPVTGAEPPAVGRTVACVQSSSAACFFREA